MRNLRKYGHRPFSIIVIHGGPGAPGEMAPVARRLSMTRGVLEPLQTADSVEGQLEELMTVMEHSSDPPVVLIGFSWGAWLGYLVTASHPLPVRKLILVSSGPFEEKYAARIMEERLGRLAFNEKREVELLSSALNSKRLDEAGLARFGELIGKADAYDPLPEDPGRLKANPDIFQKVWAQASELRSSGKLLRVGEKIQCPVVAIHGDYDPHPGEGVRGPLSRVVKDFRFILLERCGHRPWLERQAAEAFYDTLEKEIRAAPRHRCQTR